MSVRTRAIEYLRYLLICSIPPLIGWWMRLNPVQLYGNEAPPSNPFIEISWALLALGFGTGMLFIPIHWVAATANAFRVVKLPTMVCISLASTFVTSAFISPGDFIEYLQSKGLLWVCLGMTITCATVFGAFTVFAAAQSPTGAAPQIVPPLPRQVLLVRASEEVVSKRSHARLPFLLARCCGA